LPGTSVVCWIAAEIVTTDGGKAVENVEVIPVGRLKRRLGGKERLTVPAGQNVNAMLAVLDVDPRSTMVMVNGRRVARDHVLHAGDKVKLLRLITGG
jgi:sulfur carrier protein ThiS